jgi:23S rRNA pseudouridine1911/1915/1917 synthase
MSGAPGIEPGVDDEPLDDDAGDWSSDEAERAEDAPRGAALIVTVPETGAFGGRLDKLLAGELPEFTRGQLQRFIEEGRVLVNGGAARAKDKVRAGARIEVWPGPGPATAALADPTVKFGVLFEDEQLIVVDKPAGLVVHPGRGHSTGTLVNGLLARPGFERPAVDPRDPDGQLRPGIVHRIDKDTSGLLVVAKTDKAHEGLARQFKDHSIRRLYQAIVNGVPTTAKGTVDTWIGRSDADRKKMAVQREGRGKHAVTHYRVMDRLKGAAMVECRLETGRTHQVRVHMAHLGHPLLGDPVYARLGFIHPVDGSDLNFDSPLPRDMQELFSHLNV